MELPSRDRGDVLLKSGELTDLRRRLRAIAPGHDLVTVIANAFDFRTRLPPFVLLDTRVVPAGARAVGSALADIGATKTRIVLQQWTPRFRPSEMRLAGRMPDLLMLSSVQTYTAAVQGLIRDAWKIDPKKRPLIIAGGPKVFYEPWDVFSADPDDPWGADVAVTGEEYVLLSLLEVLLEERAGREPLRETFRRARRHGLLDGIPGLVYARGGREGVAEELIDTGIQRLVSDLDELPHPVHGYAMLEPPGRHSALAARPLAPEQVRRYTKLGSLVLTLGCKFHCAYCPIPGYNQRQYRTKSGARIADEMYEIYKHYRIRHFFGADDNFFNNKRRTLDIVEALVRTERDGVPLRKKMRWATEVTVHDTLQMKDHLREVRKAGLRALWIGVEDMTATLVKKGQSANRTLEAFRLLRERGIVPMPMMMHYDGQPLISRGPVPYGLLNQAHILRKAGACSMQFLTVVPAPGSRWQDEAYSSGLVFESVGGRPVEPYMIDGNYVVASRKKKPWRIQVNLWVAYLFFYNPLRLLVSIVRPKCCLYLMDCVPQVIGMWGLIQNVRRTFGWMLRLAFGKIKRTTRPPTSPVPVRDPKGDPVPYRLSEAPASRD